MADKERGMGYSPKQWRLTEEELPSSPRWLLLPQKNRQQQGWPAGRSSKERRRPRAAGKGQTVAGTAARMAGQAVAGKCNTGWEENDRREGERDSVVRRRAGRSPEHRSRNSQQRSEGRTAFRVVPNSNMCVRGNARRGDGFKPRSFMRHFKKNALSPFNF